MLDADEYLFPRDLAASDSGIDKCLFIGSCMSITYVSHFREWFPNTAIDMVLFNNVAELPEISADEASAYKFQVIQIPLRHVIGDGIIRFNDFVQNGATITSNALETLGAMLNAALKHNRDHGILTIVSNFIVPQGEFVAGLDNAGGALDLRGLVRQLNDEIVRLIAEHANTYLLDAENIASVIGKRYFLDDMIVFASHGAFWFDDWNSAEMGRLEEVAHIETISPSHLTQFLRTVWRNIEAIHRVANQIDQVKLVIFDLDDTMWRGILADHYGEVSAPMTIGWPMGMHEAVHYLRARGILTAVCSKNSPEVVRDLWHRAVPDGFITLDEFTFLEIGWGPKAEAIGRILEQANLTPKSVVFVDDNPVERQSVSAAFPGIRCLAAKPFDTRRVLLNAPETQVPRLTTETIRRETMIRFQKDRDTARKSLSREEFLASLNCRVDLFTVADEKDPDFGRAMELLNKTNQFNTTGRRWTFSELTTFFRSGGEMFAFRVTDRFTSYGLVGVVLLQDRRFEQFVMSCRVLGLEIESAVLAAIMNLKAAMDGRPSFSALMVHTEANLPSRALYQKTGFVDVDSEPGLAEITMTSPLSTSPHLEISVGRESAVVG